MAWARALVAAPWAPLAEHEAPLAVPGDLAYGDQEPGRPEPASPSPELKAPGAASTEDLWSADHPAAIPSSGLA